MNNSDALKQLMDQLGNKKAPFFNNLELKIYNEVKSKSPGTCLTLIERSGNIKWKPSEATNGYMPRLIAFMRKKNYKGSAIDSALTDIVVDIVVNEYTAFYKENSELMAPIILERLVNNKFVLENLSAQIVESLDGTLPNELKKQVVQLLVSKLDESLHLNIAESTGHAVSVLIGKVTAAGVSIPISKSLAMMLLKHIVILMKGTMGKALIASASKMLALPVIKKLVIGKVIVIVSSFLAAKFGFIGGGAAFMWILIPAFIAYMAYEVNSLPEKLAKKLSKEIKNQLTYNFESLNKDIITALVKGFTNDCLGAFASQVAGTPEIKSTVNELICNIRKKAS